MSRWFRVYDDLVDDPKIQRLPGETVKSLLNLWCLASQNDGALPPADDIAFKLRLTPAKVTKLLSVLGECGLIDSDDTSIRPHNWNARQYKSDVADPTAALRQKAYRDRLKNRDDDRNDTVTVTDTRAETEQIKEDAAPAAPDPEKDLYVRGKVVLGKQGGGLIAKLLKSKAGNIALARAAIEQASTKSDPREYVGRIINGQKPGETQWLGGEEGII